MKRLVLLLTVVVLAVVAVAVVGAAQVGGMAQSPEGEEMNFAAMGPMGPAAIAVSGEGVYVVTRGMVLKYDGDLNLVRQVALPAVQMPRRMAPAERMGGGGRGGAARRRDM